MSKQARFTRERSGQEFWQLAVGLLGILCVLILGALFAWRIHSHYLLQGSLSLWGALALFTVQAVWVVACGWCLTYVPLKSSWRYRLAFLLPLGPFTIFWLMALLWMSAGIAALWLIIAMVGAFSGGLLNTFFREPPWENNSPPSPRIQAEVRQRHTGVIGTPGGILLTKRLFDLGLSVLGLVISAPVWLVITFLVWFEDPGPVLFVKNSVGMGGINFLQFKFRTMVRSAELSTGPVLASQVDERVLWMGRLLRKTALDELPQLINIFKGEMSFVGPRPQRTVLVHGYLEQVPEYANRHRVLPGLAGLAQVAGDYYLTPRQKLRLDRLYIQHASLGFDLKLIYLAFLITFWYRWQPAWNGRLPRRYLHPARHTRT